MISFLLSLVALVLGYLIYGKFVERIVGPDDRITPAVAMADGVDYIVMPNWRIFMIQFLNIAGTGPIFGAIMGAWYGPGAYLWIVLGCIFAGAMHDYFSGMLSIRHKGANQPEIIGLYLGKTTRIILLCVTVLLLILVGAVFVYSPALLLQGMAPIGIIWWVGLIFVYYIFATMLPIDKLIGRVYPLFAISLLFMALGLLVMLFLKWPALPEVWTPAAELNMNEPVAGLTPAQLLGVDSFIAKNPVFPCLFITIACGAISGFHATQSPLMARCMKSERMGRPIFYGSMITEGLVALVWATASSYFFYYGGWKELVSPDVAAAFLSQVGGENGKTLVQYFTAPNVVSYICNGWLGLFGGILAVLGVVAAPITSGDTALRSARLIIASALGVEQRSIPKRFLICLPIFGMALAVLIWQMENPDGFNTIWQYFGWTNQTLSVFMLWAITVYLVKQKKLYVVSLVPALFMTTVSTGFLFLSPQAFGKYIPTAVGYGLIAVVILVSLVWFFRWKHNNEAKDALNK